MVSSRCGAGFGWTERGSVWGAEANAWAVTTSAAGSGSCCARLGALHRLCAELLPPPDGARLAGHGRLQRVHRGPVHRDVRLPADALPAVGRAWVALPGARPDPRGWPPAERSDRLAGRPASEPVPPRELRRDGRRVHRAGAGTAGDRFIHPSLPATAVRAGAGTGEARPCCVGVAASDPRRHISVRAGQWTRGF